MIFNRTPKIDAETVDAIGNFVNSEGGMAVLLTLLLSAAGDFIDKAARSAPLFSPVYHKFVDETGIEGVDDFADFAEFMLLATGQKKDTLIGRLVDRVQAAKGFSSILKNFRDSR